jgi:hypothetical protein
MIGKVACLPQTSLDTRRGWPPKNPVRNANESLLDSEMTVEFRSPICHSPHWPPWLRDSRIETVATPRPLTFNRSVTRMLRPTTDNARFESDSSFLRRSRSDSARLVGNPSMIRWVTVCRDPPEWRAVDSRKRLQANYSLFTDPRRRDEDTLVFTVNGVRRGLHTAGVRGPSKNRKTPSTAKNAEWATRVCA